MTRHRYRWYEILVIIGGLALLLVVFALTGCATTKTTVYSQSGKTEAEFAHDRYDCQQDARAYVGPDLPIRTIADGVRSAMASRDADRRFYQCMTLRGWTGPGRQEGTAAYGAST